MTSPLIYVTQINSKNIYTKNWFFQKLNYIKIFTYTNRIKTYLFLSNYIFQRNIWVNKIVLNIFPKVKIRQNETWNTSWLLQTHRIGQIIIYRWSAHYYHKCITFMWWYTFSKQNSIRFHWFKNVIPYI